MRESMAAMLVRRLHGAASPAATIAPPNPVPSATPSTSASCSPAEAAPTESTGASASTITDAIEYARPMPSPATPHPAAATATGTTSSRTVAINPIPAATSTSPAIDTERTDRRVASRACTHAPAVQVRVAAGSASPAIVVLCPRTDVSMRGRNASAPTNANVWRLRMVTAAGRPSAASTAPVEGMGLAWPDGDVGDGRRRARTEALHGPAGDDDGHRRRPTADPGPRPEQHGPRDERRSRAARVGLVTRHGDADQVGEHERA